ncbi:MAG TPA: hypothetical protein VF748_14910 [Candidatus Acidoferrum sp.]
MRVLRVFIKPAGNSWIDFPVPDGATMQQVLPQVRLDGMFVHDRAAIPWDGMLFGAMLDLPDSSHLSMVVPSGKPN